MLRRTDNGHEEIRILIVDDDAEMANTIRRWLATIQGMRVVGVATNARDGINLALRHRPSVILMDVYMPDMDGLEATHQLNMQLPSRVILMSAEGNREAMLQQALRVGARNFLAKPLHPPALATAIREVAEIPLPFAAEAGSSEKMTAKRQGQRGQHVIAVLGAKGGVGRSVIATNVAVALVELQAEVVLVDGNLRSGDDHILLNLHTQYTIDDLYDRPELDVEAIHQTAATHESGLALLRAPLRADSIDEMTAEKLRAVLVEIREHYDYIVIDVDSKCEKMATAALDIAEAILFVTTLEITSLHHVTEFFAMLQSQSIPIDRCRLICNRADGGYQIKPVHMERHLGRRFAALLPDDVRTVVGSVNKGVPFVLSQRRAPITRAVHAIAKHLYTTVGSATKEKA